MLMRAGLVLAAAALILTIWAMLQPQGPRGVLVRWFGPPQVELSEAYAATDGVALFDHRVLDGLLREFVDDDGYVDYKGLAGSRGELQNYVGALAAAPFDELRRDEKLALLINAYNAFTLELILEHAPPRSIRDIPDPQRWDAVRWNVAGRTFSLNQIEHEQIRPKFREPRIHFALVCAAASCPPLRREAYTGARLNEQLENQAYRVHHDKRWLRYELGAETIELTSIYEWYRNDFEQVAGTILDYVARYRDDLNAGERPGVRFIEYDWALNDQRGRESPAR
jgi:hypothetical protein